MTANTLRKTAPLPKELELALKDCYQRELKHLEPIVTCTYHTALQLMQRGLLSAKTFTKKRKALYGFYVTQAGTDYLSQLQA